MRHKHLAYGLSAFLFSLGLFSFGMGFERNVMNRAEAATPAGFVPVETPPVQGYSYNESTHTATFNMDEFVAACKGVTVKIIVNRVNEEITAVCGSHKEQMPHFAGSQLEFIVYRGPQFGGF
ncbi:hypothetical protein HYS28_01780 [Candidatus Uhrbacteria bacterium]|nr:hypothetical protein [Candidatus Uhrbacteria bacterium]